jgi:ABC-type phosphate/phosphonate transport system substrate-binding protein
MPSIARLNQSSTISSISEFVMILQSIKHYSQSQRIIRAPLLSLFLFFSALSFAGTSDPYARDTAYISGLSQQHFNKNRNDITIATEMLFNEIVTRIGFKDLDFSVNDNATDLLRAMREDRLDAVFANPINYLELDKQTNPDYRYTISYGHQLEQRIYLLATKSDAVSDLSQLKGKRLSITKDHIVGRMFLEIQLARAGLDMPNSYFSVIHETTSCNAAVLDLFFGKADLAVATDVAYDLASELNPQLMAKIQIITASSPYIPFIIGINKQVPSHLIKQIDTILLELKDQPRFKHILSLFSATDVVKVRDDQIESLRKLKSQHQKLTQ